MEDYFYLEILPFALEYGMTEYQFWYEDSDLFYAYQKAYINKTHNQAHLQGFYNYLALSTIVGNMLKEKGKESVEYPTTPILNPFVESENKDDKKLSKNQITRENLEEQYRIRLSQCY